MSFARILGGSALDIPHSDASFDLAFTSGVLIHLAPRDLAKAMDEIHRISRTWIWGLEYYAPEITEIPYRGQSNIMWKADYAQLFLQRCNDLELVLEERVAYLHDKNVDSMYLLSRKKK
jgi:ubiquinone/menaquinone biosynthesis C-methylase UbiE